MLRNCAIEQRSRIAGSSTVFIGNPPSSRATTRAQLEEARTARRGKDTRQSGYWAEANGGLEHMGTAEEIPTEGHNAADYPRCQHLDGTSEQCRGSIRYIQRTTVKQWGM